MKNLKEKYDESTILNVPNILMFIRVILTPFIMYFLYSAGNYYIPCLWASSNDQNGKINFRIIACVLFVIASLTDRYDGIYARKHGHITTLGKIGDPIADKLLTGGTMIILSINSNLPWAITIIVFIREWLITILRLSVLKKKVVPANFGGKIKTNLQIFGIIFYILPTYKLHFLNNFPQILMIIACFWTVVTGIDYLVKITKK